MLLRERNSKAQEEGNVQRPRLIKDQCAEHTKSLELTQQARDCLPQEWTKDVNRGPAKKMCKQGCGEALSIFCPESLCLELAAGGTARPAEPREQPRAEPSHARRAGSSGTTSSSLRSQLGVIQQEWPACWLT